jgi:hypothetical protein
MNRFNVLNFETGLKIEILKFQKIAKRAGGCDAGIAAVSQRLRRGEGQKESVIGAENE